MDISKSSRHARIVGEFGEALVLYWLSKYGFECARVDHTGIDLIANNPHTGEVMGISVKSRTRSPGTEYTNVRIDSDEFGKVEKACEAFGCAPYFALVIDAGSNIRCFLLSMRHLLELAPVGLRVSSWKMGPKYLTNYFDDPEIRIFELQSETKRWWGFS